MLKQLGDFFQTFVDFSEYLNFIQHNFGRYDKDWYQFTFLSQFCQILFEVAFQLPHYFTIFFSDFLSFQNFLLIFFKICWWCFNWNANLNKFGQIVVCSTMNFKQIIFKCHGLRTHRESFFRKSQTFGVFSAGLSAPILVLWVPCPCFPLINHYF
jgi:hypothetical protein